MPLTIDDRYKAGAFTSYEDWVQNARRELEGRNAICVDAMGRECWIWRQFQRARDQGTGSRDPAPGQFHKEFRCAN